MTVKALQLEPQLIRQALQVRSEPNLLDQKGPQQASPEVQTLEAEGRLKMSKSSRRWGSQFEINSTLLHMHIIRCHNAMITHLIVKGF